MGTGTLSRLRSEALLLPEAERAELAHKLVKSLDAPADVDVADAWDNEILLCTNFHRMFHAARPWLLMSRLFEARLNG